MSERTARAVVEDFYRRYGAGDVDGALALLAPDVVHRACPGSAGAALCGVWHGVDAVRERVADLVAAFAMTRWEPVRIVAEGDDVAAQIACAGTVRATGEPFETTLSHQVAVRDGRIAALEEYFDSSLVGRLLGAAPGR